MYDEITTVALKNDPNGIFEDQTTAGAGSLSLNGNDVSGGVAYCYGTSENRIQAQKISIEGTGNNSGVVATITGTAFGATITENLTLANNGTATSTGWFETVTSITVDGAVTGNIEGGWLSSNGAVTRPIMCDRRQVPFDQSVSVYLDGTMTYTVEHTSKNPRDEYTIDFSSSATWLDTDGLTSLTASGDGNHAYPVSATRLNITSYTSGTATIIARQGS